MLRLILDQEISPELVPVAEGERPQSTEDSIGPYALQDFTLFHVLRYGFPPSRIAFLARARLVRRRDRATGRPASTSTRGTAYDLPTIRRWLEVFVRRFFAFSQFKRSAIPNGPKVVAGGSLSPRGEWRAPSDGNATVWLDELDRNVPALYLTAPRGRTRCPRLRRQRETTSVSPPLLLRGRGGPRQARRERSGQGKGASSAMTTIYSR